MTCPGNLQKIPEWIFHLKSENKASLQEKNAINVKNKQK